MSRSYRYFIAVVSLLFFVGHVLLFWSVSNGDLDLLIGRVSYFRAFELLTAFGYPSAWLFLLSAIVLFSSKGRLGEFVGHIAFFLGIVAFFLFVAAMSGS